MNIDDYSLSLDNVIQIIHSADPNKCQVSDYDKTLDFKLAYDLTNDDIIGIVKTIEKGDYVKGPETDRNLMHPKPFWIFKKRWNSLRLYIKIKIYQKNETFFVFSIHIDG